MGYPRHWLLNWTGHQGDPEESFSNGIRMVIYGPQDAPMDEEQYLDDTAVPALSAWFARATTLINSSAVMLLIKFNEIGPDGEYADEGVTHERPVNVPGGVASSAARHPLQVAWCLSWRTNDKIRGLGSHGRIYVPRPAVAVDAAGDVSGPNRVSAAESAVLLLNSLDVSIGIPPGAVLRPSIVSRGRRAPDGTYGPGEAHQIDEVVVDSSCDIIRRRSRTQTKEVTGLPVVYS